VPLKEAVEVIWAKGHGNIQALHPTTLMFTTEQNLSATGDCIVAVAADKAAADLSPQFKAALKQPNTQLTITIEADDLKEQISAHGSPELTLTHATDLVVRKSSFRCSRTLAIQADKASKDLPRSFVEKLQDPNQTVKITLQITKT
jgi:hypothetical protein